MLKFKVLNKNNFIPIHFYIVYICFQIVFFIIFFIIDNKEASATCYRMEYGIQTDTNFVKMPVPISWPNSGKVNIIEIIPYPDNFYSDENGNEIAEWKNDQKIRQSFVIKFEIELSIKKDDEIYAWMENNLNDGGWAPYNTKDQTYQIYTSPGDMVQSDNSEVMNKAYEIVGNEIDPLKKAQSIHKWVADNLSYSKGTNDALSALKQKKAACGGYAALFVAFCRVTGIPARIVSGIHPIGTRVFNNGIYGWDGPTGSGSISLGAHIWAEFYLPEYGWMQVDPTFSSANKASFGSLFYERIVTAKGKWFHLPRGSENLESEPIWLKVEKINHVDYFETACASFDLFTNTLHVPCLNIGVSYWLDLQLMPGDPISFQLSDFGENLNSDAQVNAECSTFDLFTNTLHVPCLNMGVSYWLDLQLMPGDPISFQLSDFGEKQNNGGNDTDNDGISDN